jgi:protein gp37
MGEHSKIEWTDHTFNPWWGCTKVPGDPACHHCYAEAFSRRLGLKVWGQAKDRRFFGDKHWNEPLKWNRKAAEEGVRRRVFCASMSDVFEDRPDLEAARARLWDLIAATPWLDWLLLTKRPENIARMLTLRERDNVWLGTTVVTAEWAAKRIPALLQNEAAVRFLSCEPLVEALDLSPWIDRLDWVIVGAESGGKSRAMDEAWVRPIRDACVGAGVPFFYKQDATASGKKIPTPELDGRIWAETPRSTHDEYPERGAADASGEAAATP